MYTGTTRLWVVPVSFVEKNKTLHTAPDHSCFLFAAFHRNYICAGDWICAARSCLSRCTLEFVAIHAASLYPLVFLKVRLLSYLHALEKTRRALYYFYVMVIRCVAPITNKSAKPRTHMSSGVRAFTCCNSPFCGQ